MSSLSSQRYRRLLLVTWPLALAGCAGFSADAGLDAVRKTAADRLGQPITLAQDRASEARSAALLAHPLSADDAVQVALLNNPTLRAALAELDIAEADWVQAGRLPNPGLSFGRLSRNGEVEIDRGIQFNLMRLLTLPASQALEAQRYAQVRADASARVVALANATRLAWVDAVAATQSVAYLAQVQRSADASATLAARMVAAGNWNTLDEAREQGYRSDAQLNLVRARQAEIAARERFARLLGAPAGMAGASAFTLPARLPDLPEALPAPAAFAQRALTERLDVQATRLEAEATARRLGLTKATRFVNLLEVGAQRNSYADGSTERGVQLSIELPLFDSGEARVKRAEAVYQQALNRAAATTQNALSELRETYALQLSRYETARRYRDEIVPRAQRVGAENLKRYNAMLIGVFDLLADARTRIATVNAALDAQRDFWRAKIALENALIGAPAFSTTSSRELP